MINPLECCPNLEIPTVYDDSLSYYTILCKVLMKLDEVITQSNTTTDAVNAFKAWVLQECVTHAQIQAQYMLDRTGNFTGTIYGLPAYTVNANRDAINYLTAQFNHGQVGMVINGGFFTDTGIRNSYNGGYF